MKAIEGNNETKNTASTVNGLIQDLESRKAYIESLLSFKCIEACNFIVASTDTMYTVGSSEGVATVDIDKVCPVQFTKEEAERISKEFEASNGRGLIVWTIFLKSEFYKQRLTSINEMLTLLSK